jgi:hypothetical protein
LYFFLFFSGCNYYVLQISFYVSYYLISFHKFFKFNLPLILFADVGC